MNNKLFQSQLKSKDIKNKHLKSKSSKQLKAFKIQNQQWPKLNKALILFHIIAIMLQILKLIMIKKKEEEAITSVKINGTDMLINAMVIQLNKSEIELPAHSKIKLLKFQPLMSFLIFGKEIMDLDSNQMLKLKLEIKEMINLLDLHQISLVQLNLEMSKPKAVLFKIFHQIKFQLEEMMEETTI